MCSFSSSQTHFGKTEKNGNRIGYRSQKTASKIYTEHNSSGELPPALNAYQLTEEPLWLPPQKLCYKAPVHWHISISWYITETNKIPQSYKVHLPPGNDKLNQYTWYQSLKDQTQTGLPEPENWINRLPGHRTAKASLPLPREAYHLPVPLAIFFFPCPVFPLYSSYAPFPIHILCCSLETIC